MSNRFFTSDHHFGHANILKYEAQNRVDDMGERFLDVDAMGEHLIARWNDTVGPDDEVFVLGDFSFKRAVMASHLPRLNGKKHLICGNHDPFFKSLISSNSKTAEKSAAIATQAALDLGWSSVLMSQNLHVDGVGNVLLSHFPYETIATANVPAHALRYQHLSPKRNGDEVALLHGHVHGRWKVNVEQYDQKKAIMINVGVDVWGLRPASEREIALLIKAAG